MTGRDCARRMCDNPAGRCHVGAVCKTKGHRTMDQGAPRAIHLKDYAPPPYRIETVELTVDLGEEVTTVRSRLGLAANPGRGAGAPPPLVLDGQDLHLVSVAI